MRELDFSNEKIAQRWLRVKEFWEEELPSQVSRHVKKSLEKMLKVEFRQFIGCAPYKRSKKRKGHRNGSYERGLQTLYGWVEDLKVPRDRAGKWHSEVLGHYQRRQGALDQLILECFLLGHSTRKTVRVFKRAFGASISPQAVSNVVKSLKTEVEAFHSRSLRDEYRFLFLDGKSITVISPFKVKKVLLVAYGIKADGSEELIDFLLATSESESNWWGFLWDLKSRGLKGRGLEVVIHDGAGGLVKALEAHYPRVLHQYCVFHRLQNITINLSDPRHRSAILRDAAFIFQAESFAQLRERVRFFQERWRENEPKAVRNLLNNLSSSLTYLSYPEPWRTRIKTNNPLERIIEEFERRMKPFRKFPNEGSANRIIYGIVTYVLENKKTLSTDQNFTQPC